MMGSLLMALLLLPVLAPTVHAAFGDLCDRTKLTNPATIDVEKFQGRWYVHSHTNPRYNSPILYIDMDVTGSDRLTYEITVLTANGDCINVVRDMIQEGQENHFVNTTSGIKTELYFTYTDSCYSTGIAYMVKTDITTGVVNDFVGLHVRNPKANPSAVVRDELKTELCLGETLGDWYHPANRLRCSC